MSAAEGERLDLWLAGRRGTSRHQAHDLVAGGHVAVNGRPGRPGTRVSAGDSIIVSEPPFAAAPALAGPPVALRITFEDESIAVIDKPAGLVVHPAPGHPHGTLADGLRQRGDTWSLLGGAERPGIVHRLDRDTSGLLVVAKTERAHRHLSAQLERRTLGRSYWALVHGSFAEETARIDAPIGRDHRDRKRMAVVDSGRPSVTDLRIVGRFPRSSELDVDLHSGRTHQIRVHLAHIGHPLLGDPVYGRRDAARLTLHARRLHLLHPMTGEERRFESPLPADLVAIRDAAADEIL
ncbi:MAG: RluA family pseudouridine synthase [Candidatus Dormibacteria bacterium]